MTTPSSNPSLNAALASIANEAAAELDPVWKLPAKRIIPALFEVIPPLVDKWGLASSSAAADWYDELRAHSNVRGRFSAIVEKHNLGGVSLAGWAAQPLKAAPQTGVAPSEMPIQHLDPVQEAQYRVEGGIQKRIVNAANHTITNSAKQDPQARGWMRLTRPEACRFCRMVASRGGVFTQATATFACHEKCYCSAVPVWGGKPIHVGPYKPSDRPNNAQERARVKAWIKKNL